LQRVQRPDGSWLPLWFGNQDHPAEENPVYGTAKVLQAYADCGRSDTSVARRGFEWLASAQNEDGGWGGGPAIGMRNTANGCLSSIEETALAVEALSTEEGHPSSQAIMEKGLTWIVTAVEDDRHRQCSPIGFYFAKLWYYEKLYPMIFTVSALGRAIRRLLPLPKRRPESAHLSC
jgi:squalene-hopene/tetraprenyl-beta-curcumene cyclase